MPRKPDQAAIDEKIRKSLKYSIADGTFFSTMVGFGESFLSAFAVFLKASNFQIGLLGSLPQALGSISQIFSKAVINRFRSRKRVVYTGAFLQALMFIPISLVFFLGDYGMYYLIFFVSLYWIFVMIPSPAWTSWMGDLVDERVRGSYFGRRNKIAGIASFVSLLAAGYILQTFSNGTAAHYFGFVLIFMIALVARVLSSLFMMKQYEPKYKTVREANFSFRDFLKQARFRNYGLLTFYLCFMNFAVYMAAPFFTAYMLYDLRLDYMTFTIITVVALAVKYVMMPVWGRAADRFGTRKVISLSGFMMPVVPALWLISPNVLFLILVQAYSGFVWAGFEIASFNLIFDTTSPQKRATCVAYYNVLNGVAIMIGGVVGGIIVKYNDFFWSKYLFIFLMSTVFRYTASLLFIPRIKEVRLVEYVPYGRLLTHIVSSMPTASFFRSAFRIRLRRKRIEEF